MQFIRQFDAAFGSESFYESSLHLIGVASAWWEALLCVIVLHPGLGKILRKPSISSSFQSPSKIRDAGPNRLQQYLLGGSETVLIGVVG